MQLSKDVLNLMVLSILNDRDNDYQSYLQDYLIEVKAHTECQGDYKKAVDAYDSYGYTITEAESKYINDAVYAKKWW